jgi:GntR family transcriptional regulator, transcriptional repressor for pyruvate dehydrogenase complex
MDLKPIEQLPLYVRVAKQIEKLILDGKIQEGQKLPTEKELCETLRVSRASVREAMAQLLAKGLVRKRMHAGYYIEKSFDHMKAANGVISLLLEEDSYPIEILQARLMIEPKMCELAASQATDSDIVTLNTILKKMKTLSDDPAKHLAVDVDFHVQISRITKNRVIKKIYPILADLIKKDLWPIMKERSWSKENRFKMYEIQHTEIFKAISQRDGKHAQNAMKDHLNFIIDDITKWTLKDKKSTIPN